MNWTPENLPKPTSDTSLMKYQLDQFGYCIIQNALDDSTLGLLQSRLLEQAEVERQLHNHKNPANLDPVNQWVGMLLNKGDIFMRLLEHELCMGLLEYMLGRDFLVSCVDAQIQHPGAIDMPLHTDQWWMPRPVTSPQVRNQPADYARGQDGSTDPARPADAIYNIGEANIMWFVTDFTEHNGATRIVPGSHVSGRQPDPAIPHPVNTVAATGPAGTAIAFDGRIWHAGGANSTRQSRYGITTAGCGPQFRTIENYTRGMRPEVFERCDSAILSRLGFKSWSGYGHTGDPNEEVSAIGVESAGPLYHSDFSN